MTVGNSINSQQGTSGQVWTSQGTSSPPVYVNSNTVGEVVLLNTYTANTSASIDITSQMSATYRYMRVVISGLVFSNTSTIFQMKMSTDNGATWLAGTSYDYANVQLVVGNSNQATGGSGQSVIALTKTLTSVSNTINGEVTIFRTTNNCTAIFALSVPISSTTTQWMGGARYNTSGTVDAVQFLMSAGTFTSGTFKLYGIKA